MVCYFVLKKTFFHHHFETEHYIDQNMILLGNHLHAHGSSFLGSNSIYVPERRCLLLHYDKTNGHVRQQNCCLILVRISLSVK